MVRGKHLYELALAAAAVLGSSACDPTAEEKARLAFYQRVAERAQLDDSPGAVLAGSEDAIQEARRLVQSERPRQSAALLLAWLARGGDPELGLPELALALEKLQEVELAEEALQIAIEGSEDPGSHWCRLAELRIRQRDYSGARLALCSYEASRPESTGHASFLAGLSFQSELRLEEALESYRRCLELDRDNDPVILKLAQVHSLLGNEPEAERLLDELLARKPRYLPALIEAARLYHRQERFERALEVGLAVLEQEPDHRRTLFLVSQCYRRLGERQKSDELFARFTRAEERADAQRRQESQREGIAILLEKARTALTEGREQEAQEVLHQVLRIDPSHVAARQLLEGELVNGPDESSRSRR